MHICNYCPFDITRKNVVFFSFFRLAFYLKWKCIAKIDHILSETTCLFCSCVLFSNIYPKITFTAKNWSDLYNLYSKVFVWNFVWENIFFPFLAEFWIIDVSQQYYENFRKNECAEPVELLNIYLQVTYPTDFCIICINFCYGKNENILLF